MALGSGGEIRELRRAIEALGETIARGGGGGKGGGGSGGPLGASGGAQGGTGSGGGSSVARSALIGGASAGIRGGLGAVAGGLMRGGALGVAAAGGAALTGIAAGGALNSARGGSGVAGVQQSVNNLIAGIPFLGEVSGAAGTRRVQQGAQSDVQNQLNDIARFGGADSISPELLNFAADLNVKQNQQIEKLRARSTAAIADRTTNSVVNAQGEATGGSVLAQLLGAIQSLASAVDGKGVGGSRAGSGRHT